MVYLFPSLQCLCHILRLHSFLVETFTTMADSGDKRFFLSYRQDCYEFY
jgi:hypothetical protein